MLLLILLLAPMSVLAGEETTPSPAPQLTPQPEALDDALLQDLELLELLDILLDLDAAGALEETP